MGKDKVFNNIGAAILAGGKSSRMSGLNKALIEINGSSVIQRTIKILRSSFEEIIIVTNSPEEFKLFEKEAMIITDVIKNAGPLGGIHAALSATSKKEVFFVACDMPFLHNAVIHQQLDYFSKINCDSLVPKHGSSIEPLHAVYKKRLKHDIEVFLKNSRHYSIRCFLETVNTHYLELGESRFYKNVFKNLNTPEDLTRILQ